MPSKIGSILVFIGGLNWGLIGLGMLLGKGTDWNVVHMILGSWMTVEAIVYLLVGIAAIMRMVGCKCKKCMAACASCSCSTGSSDGKMDGNM
jgi:uncharacterized membrane protein YuzA (DUF378 family)